MKTLNEVYNEIIASEELKKKAISIKSAAEAVEFVKTLGAEATAEEIAEFVKSKKSKSGELSDTELTQIAGGKGADGLEALLSVVSAGIGCAAIAIVSETTGKTGTEIKSDHMLCYYED